MRASTRNIKKSNLFKIFIYALAVQAQRYFLQNISGLQRHLRGFLEISTQNKSSYKPCALPGMVKVRDGFITRRVDTIFFKIGLRYFAS